MTAQQLQQLADAFTETSPDNRIPSGKAMRPDLAGLKLFDPPLLGFAGSNDSYLLGLRDSGAMLEGFMAPAEWMPEAATVVSFFSPFTEAVRKSNRRPGDWPSKEWLHARVDGQVFIFKLVQHLQAALEAAGHKTLSPSSDSRFWQKPRAEVTGAPGGSLFTTNWSERHAAYACGLGTFSLSKGLITEKGVAGRFGSLLTDLELPPTGHGGNLEANCNRCGACVATCPANAITLENGKDDIACNAFLDSIRAAEAPYYGCGKCQTGVPCEHRIPASAGRQSRV